LALLLYIICFSVNSFTPFGNKSKYSCCQQKFYPASESHFCTSRTTCFFNQWSAVLTFAIFPAFSVCEYVTPPCFVLPKVQLQCFACNLHYCWLPFCFPFTAATSFSYLWACIQKWALVSLIIKRASKIFLQGGTHYVYVKWPEFYSSMLNAIIT